MNGDTGHGCGIRFAAGAGRGGGRGGCLRFATAGTEPGDSAREKAQQQLVATAAAPLTGAAVKLIVEICTANLQTIDLDTQDKLVRAKWDADARERSAAFVSEFETFCREHR